MKNIIFDGKYYYLFRALNDDDKETSEEWTKINCQYLKHKLNQESILVTKEVIQANFY